MDGNEVEGKSEMKYEGKRRRVLTMYEMKDGKPIKMMEITYERAPASQPAAK